MNDGNDDEDDVDNNEGEHDDFYEGRKQQSQHVRFYKICVPCLNSGPFINTFEQLLYFLDGLAIKLAPD